MPIDQGHSWYLKKFEMYMKWIIIPPPNDVFELSTILVLKQIPNLPITNLGWLTINIIK